MKINKNIKSHIPRKVTLVSALFEFGTEGPNDEVQFGRLLSLLKFLNLVDFHPQHLPSPEVGLRTHFRAEVAEEFGWVGQLLPNLG